MLCLEPAFLRTLLRASPNGIIEDAISIALQGSGATGWLAERRKSATLAFINFFQTGSLDFPVKNPRNGGD
jgi:hypothetical protein